MERTRVDFLANASHELRTPLASLSGFIETLRGHARDDPAAREKFLGIMQAQADRMARLIADLTSLSRIELDEHVPPRGVVDLVLVVGEVVEAAGAAGPRSAASSSTGGPARRGQVTVRGERDQIVQVVQNLLDNAIKYSPAGAPVRIELRDRAHRRRGRARARPGRRAAPVAGGARPFAGDLCGAAGHRPGPRHRAPEPAPALRALLSGRRPEERRAVGHRAWAWPSSSTS